MTSNQIIEQLPYGSDFLFVDSIEKIDTESISGSYHFKGSEYFYPSHFKSLPVTPGVILTETMAQIGLVSFGIYLLFLEGKSIENAQIALSSSQVNFYLPVYPDQKVTVISVKEYFRFHKLKCTVEMRNEKDELVCKGVIAGMIRY